MTFSKTHPTLARALTERDYTQATPVQAAVLADDTVGRDLLVSAQTGSGKTVAFGLAFADDILGAAESLGPAGDPLALVIAPTRELALQVERELAWLYEHTGARITACVGGMDPRAERRRLDAGAHIVVGTPGRLRDHLERHGLRLEDLRAVVLDEADEMLDMGFRDDLEFILQATPVERRTLMFSATLPKGIVQLAQNYQRDARRIAVAGASRGHADIEHRAIRVSPKEIEAAVVNLLRFHDAPAAIVFANTREAVRHLQATLQERGFSAVALSGELGQHERNLALQALRDGRARVCVATDVAARGIDLPNLDLVVHAELPHDREVFQHRSGRTGRAGRKGVSCLLVPAPRRRRAERLLMDAGIRPIWGGPPSADEIRALDRDRMTADPALAGGIAEDDADFAALLMETRTAEEIAGALVRLWRARLPAAEEVVDPIEGERRGDRRERRDRRDDETATGVWFRCDVGRNRNADPRWLLPMLCRRGDIERGDIGTIRIFDRETLFEVRDTVAARFAAAVRRPDEENILILPAENQPDTARRDRGPAGPRADRPRDGAPRPHRGRPDGKPKKGPRKRDHA
ncbi:DEAD/DEAH box helicase [Pinisolibacter sp.]|uniref:DEAD/DEAH box helicase n=1 Tax=Pinisolibacter sp. TaxID=2172024 RepID=UPI002FDCDBCC